MNDSKRSEPNEISPSPEGKGNRSNRWLRRAFLGVAMLLLISVITSNFFHLPMYAETSKSTVIAEAMLFFTLSTVFGDAKSN